MDSKLKGIITQAERDAVMAPIEEARTLPAPAYTDTGWFALEVERIFRRIWTGVLFDCVVPDVGDALAFDVFDTPLVAVRGLDGRLRVFHNTCPYDGCPVVIGWKSGLREFDVLYHGWRYDLEGNLLDAPYWSGRRKTGPEALNGNDGHLVEVRSEVRLGTLFIDLGGQAQEIDEWLSPWSALVGRDFAFGALVPARDVVGRPLIETRTVKANWKTYQENASINILHEGFTHAFYRQSPEVPRVDADGKPAFELFQDGCLLGFGHERRESAKTYTAPPLPSAGHDSERLPDWGYFTTVFPNLNVPLLDVMMKVNIAIPISPSETRLHHLRFYREEALEAASFQDVEQATQRAFDTVHAEDQIAIEAIQRSRSSPISGQHFYAPFWDGLHHRFNQLVMAALERGA